MHLDGKSRFFSFLLWGKKPQDSICLGKEHPAFALSAHMAPRAGLPVGSAALRFILQRYFLQMFASSYKVYHAFVYFTISFTIGQEEIYS